MEDSNRNFKLQTCEDFIEVLASKAAVPGGGGAAALTGAIGIALGNMVGSLTVGKKTYADVEDNAFALAEEELGISIPSQYLWFLKTYGHGGLNGIETLGVGKNKKLIFKDETLKYRTYGLPHNLIVIENCDEWVYCIDSLNGKVKMWSRDK